MATRAYILVDTAVGKSKDVATSLKTLSGVDAVDTVTGPYDIIAVVNAPDLSAIGDLVTSQIHTVNGVRRTLTCLSIGSA